MAKPLYEQAYDNALIACEKISDDVSIETLRKMYCDGFCTGVLAAIKTLSYDPAYKEPIELMKWKMGVNEN